jgi:uncharacterized protein YjbK
MLEFEKKIILSQTEYEKLCSVYQKPIVIQENYYYDTAEQDYNRKGITLRIRKKGDKYTATVKIHSVDSDCSKELSREAESEYDTALFAGKNVVLQGCMQTERMCIPMENSIVVMLDKNTYLGMTDYEMEIEYHPRREQFCEEIIDELASKVVRYHSGMLAYDFMKRAEQSKTKSERFFERKRMLEGNAV